MSDAKPILYSFRRCPYAMRARLAIYASGIQVQLREILLRDKAPEFLSASPKGTVPVLITSNEIIEESFDIMVWSLKQGDPEHWLDMPNEGYEWILKNDGPFKDALDHTKYFVKFPDFDAKLEQEKALKFLTDLNEQIGKSNWMFGKGCSLADMALLPFIRQFSNIDKNWFYAQNLPNVHRWLDHFLQTDLFTKIMKKYDVWIKESTPVLFSKVGQSFSK